MRLNGDALIQVNHKMRWRDEALHSRWKTYHWAGQETRLDAESWVSPLGPGCVQHLVRAPATTPSSAKKAPWPEDNRRRWFNKLPLNIDATLLGFKQMRRFFADPLTSISWYCFCKSASRVSVFPSHENRYGVGCRPFWCTFRWTKYTNEVWGPSVHYKWKTHFTGMIYVFIMN